MTLPRRYDDGFTLVEMLVSLALLSLMAVYALNALSFLRDMNRISERVGSQMEVEAVARHFLETLADVRPVFVMDENNAPEFFFRGSPDALEFVSASNGDRETAGLYLVRYSVDAEGTLLAERRMLRERQSAETNKVALLRDVEGVSFRYLDSGSAVFTGEMSDTWRQKDLLPSAIEVTVIFNGNNKNPRKWPPTMVGLRTAR